MKRSKIIFPKSTKEEIASFFVPGILNERGIILVYDKDKVIGSVIFIDDEWIIDLINYQEKSDNLEDLLLEFPRYDFILLEDD